ncbi:hypothetical protein H257_03284 [Aphanomyces astaci]|uniref:Uncharacterized protein n=1 Tax=Aphanomyces astaci TaxID=112090 RepID=W4H1Y9_APHAT|nr:hypothetical protein H257_03284 [Aphanomyces astaci]ETV85576.1 hypothetical protein H257_03284 [Aphanomyces astaci]|eukprot:XP_009825594.1 hypothetical protein H257_03284 [Aphanomyces astaci]
MLTPATNNVLSRTAENAPPQKQMSSLAVRMTRGAPPASSVHHKPKQAYQEAYEDLGEIYVKLCVSTVA